MQRRPKIAAPPSRSTKRTSSAATEGRHPDSVLRALLAQPKSSAPPEVAPPDPHASSAVVADGFEIFAVEREEERLVDAGPDDDALDTVVVGVPPRQRFSRVDPQPLMRAHLLRHQGAGDFRPTLFLATPAIAELLPDDVALHDLYRWVERDGREGIWPIRVLPSRFRASELRAVAVAAAAWARIVFRRGADFGERVAIRAKVDLGEPRWSGRSRPELLARAFGERRIVTAEHPMVAELLGQDAEDP